MAKKIKVNGRVYVLASELSPNTKRYMDVLSAADKARAAFWLSIINSYPEIKTGDFPPDAADAFDQAAVKAVRTWLQYNLKE